MKKRILNWGLILSLLLTMLPVSVMAEEDELAGDGLSVTESTQCTCGAQPDEEGIIAYADGCPLAVQEEPVQEESVQEKSIQKTEASEPEALTPPALTCVPLDEENSSDMVLTAEGDWDSYAWESCSYGTWSDWSGDGPSLILSKEDFTAYGFRCTVTRGEQSVTSETFAYDPAVLERPMLLANGLAESNLEAESEYIRYYEAGRYERFDIQGMDNGTEFKTTYVNSGYRTAISVDGGAKVEVPYQSDAASVGSSLTAQTKLDIVNGDRYVKITYSVTNNGSTTQSFRIGSSADVMIGNNDCAAVTGTDTGLSMDGSPKNSYKFQLVAPDCDTLWFGFYY